ncbi:MAG: hypothetical protein RMJ98_10520 [Myxococcales bacterium]|nr:hypothetical protein [Polyangiaceae bacterium]MDW8249720.1 hypothetical protein [Myxococcales bacterium]
MAHIPSFSDEQLLALSYLAFDHLCQQRVSHFLSTEQILEAIDKGCEPERVKKFQQRFVRPQRARLLEWAKHSKVKLKDWLPEQVRDEIAAMLGQPAPLPKSWVEDAVASERVREEVKAMLHDTLTSFVSKATAGLGEAAPPAVGGAIGRLTKNFAAASKGLLGGLGHTLQKQLQEKVRDFVDGSVAAIQRRIADKLTSDETAIQMGKRRKKAFLQALEWDEAQMARWMEQQPSNRIDALLPILVQHNAARAELREAVKSEVAAVLAELETQTLGELLDELGLRAWAREGSARAGVPWLRGFFATEGFVAWWQANVPGA